MNILEKIIADKREEVLDRKDICTIAELKNAPLFGRKCISLTDRLCLSNASGVIAEFKRRSPSKGLINGQAIPSEVAVEYEAAGASGMSVLTDEIHFGGSLSDFGEVRESVKLPLLRKDFIIDEYQVYETKSCGADVVLLIAANLDIKLCNGLARLARKLGLEVLLEIHNEEELDYINDYVSLVGINNRNLKTFEVDIDNSIRLSEKIGDDIMKIAESGLSDPDTVHILRKNGFNGFLIGESFMKHDDPGKACLSFINKLNTSRES